MYKFRFKAQDIRVFSCDRKIVWPQRGVLNNG